MDDLISRQTAIDAITDERIVANMDSVYDSELHRCKRATQRILASLPSAQPERKKGTWIDLGKDRVIRWQCSECGRKDTHIYNYCPDCGAEMRGETNERN